MSQQHCHSNVRPTQKKKKKKEKKKKKKKITQKTPLFPNLSNFNSKNLSGSIPSQIGLLTSLIVLSAGTNQIAGTIPVELLKLTALTDLCAFFIEFFAIVEFTLFRNRNLGTNRFSGTIPQAIGRLENLVSL
jgi:hypothetical protein